MRRKPITLDALRALMAVVPPPAPHHYALSPDLMRMLLDVAVREQVDRHPSLGGLRGVELREDVTLSPGTFEARNRDGSPYDAASHDPATEPAEQDQP